MQQSERFGYLLIFCTGCLWGTCGPLMTIMSDAGADAETICLVRETLAFLMLLPIALIRSGPRALLLDAKALLACAALGIISQGIFSLCYAYAVLLTGVTTAAVLLNIAPIVGLLCSVLLFKETVNGLKISAMALCILGCVLVVTNGNLSALQVSLVGVLCGVGAGATYGMTAVIGRIAGTRTDPIVANTYNFLFATLFLTLWCRPWTLDIELNAGIIGGGVALALIPTVLAYLLYLSGINRIRENSKAPIFAASETVVAALLGCGLYHEQLGIVGLAGIVLVLLSIAAMSWRPRWAYPPAPDS